jgi:uncharacterized protein YndB with AHSA1/START domain
MSDPREYDHPMADDTYSVERSATIAAAPERIYEYLADFHRWTAWSPWEGIDPDLQRTYSGAESGVGATYSWSGNRKAGAGSMTIVDASAPNEVKIDLQFEKPFKARNDTQFTVVPGPSGSVVRWTMNGKKTLATRVMGIFTSMDKMIGADFERGLAQLKAAAES